MEKLKPYLTYLVIAVTIIATGFYVFKDWQAIKNNRAEQGSEQKNSATATPEAPVVKQEFIESKKITAPDLNKPVNFTANMAEDSRALLLSKTGDLSSKLKDEPSNQENWLKLAIYKKMAGDYTGAEEIWVYLTSVNPQGFIPYNNLGDLYAYHLRDDAKAERNFLKALELAPGQASLYRSIYEFYRFVLKDEVKAREILGRGIKLNISGSQDLQRLLDNPE